MSNVKVNIRFRDEQGNVYKPYEPQDPIQMLVEGSAVLAIMGALIWYILLVF